MKMIKKLISITGILAMAMTLCLVGGVNAAYNDVVFSADTPIGSSNSHQDMVVAKDSVVAGFVVGDANDVTLTLEEGSNITFESALGKIMSASCGGTFTAGSTLNVVWSSACTTSVVTIGTGTLTEINVAASLLTPEQQSAYTVTFRTINALSATDIIRLDFGGGFTLATGDTASNVVLKDDTVTITPSAVSYSDSTKKILITLNSTVAAGSIINIVLDSDLVKNPVANSLSDTGLSGIDIYTTTSGGTIIDSKPNQTAFNRVLDLVLGWNIFAPSQELEDSDKTAVMAPISARYDAIYTLTWNSTLSTMTWQTPTTIDPLYGYAVYINGSSTPVKFPLDFAKETQTNITERRAMNHAGFHSIGFVGVSASAVAQTAGNCLDGLNGTGPGGTDAFGSIIDLTKANVGNPQTTHAWDPTGNTSEGAGANSGNGTMKFTRDYGFLISINFTSDDLFLWGNRGL